MKVTLDVIRDLLPLHLAGEASADTRALVEEFLKDDPEFARSVAHAPGRLVAAEIPPVLTQEDEMKTLVATKRMVRLQSVVFAFAILFSALPFAFGSTDSRGARWLWADAPAGAALSGLIGLSCWAIYSGMRRAEGTRTVSR
jgi:anti-sigma factor RsiW